MSLSKVLKIFVGIIAALVVIIALFLFIKARETEKGRLQVLEEIRKTRYDKFHSFGSIKKLSVLPLIDFYADNDELKTEAGVSYLIRADETTILLDVGYNAKKEHPSPLLCNMEKLGIKVSDIDMIFFSHYHMDHVGGRKEMADRTFSFSQGKTDVGNIPVYVPEKIMPSSWNPGPVVKVLKAPEVLKPGIVSIGVIPRYLFIAGLTLEQSLAINVAGKGIVVIIGCGHQTIERIIERTKMIFDEPIYAIIGGLHLPVNGGRMNIGPIDLQYIVGSDKPPWDGLSEDDVKAAIKAIQEEKPKVVSLSPHDSSDWTLSEFKKAFKDEYVDLKVGKEIKI